MKKTMFLVFLALCLTLALPVWAISYDGYTQEQFDALAQTTVIASEDSPTGYYVTFRYPDDDNQRVRVWADWSFTDASHASILTSLSEDEWQNGYFNYGDRHGAEMVLNEDTGIWSYTIALPSGMFAYNYYVDGPLDTEVNDTADALRLDDPNFPSLSSGYENPAKGVGSSKVFVPYDEQKQSESPDFTFLAEKTDDKGSVSFTDLLVDEIQYPLGVYLPYGYDADREAPYKLLIMLHGGGGAETNWLGDGLQVMLDNLIADGTLPEMVVITPGIATYSDLSVAGTVVLDHALTYAEENFNISPQREDRALGGLSKGGATTMWCYYNRPEAFGYFMGFSAPWVIDQHDADMTQPDLATAKVFLGCGLYDFVKVDCYINAESSRYGVEESFYKHMQVMHDAGLSFTTTGEPPYAHDWWTWRTLCNDALATFLWK